MIFLGYLWLSWEYADFARESGEMRRKYFDEQKAKVTEEDHGQPGDQRHRDEERAGDAERPTKSHARLRGPATRRRVGVARRPAGTSPA